MEDLRKGVDYDIENQYQRVKADLFKGEQLICCFDCKGGGTGFVGLTSMRLIFLDQALLSKNKTLVSIPFNNIVAVGIEESGTIMKSAAVQLITTGGKFTFEFRDQKKAGRIYRAVLFRLLQSQKPSSPIRKIASGKG